MIERTVLNAAEYRTNCLLDLDAGDFVPPPLALNLTNREAVWFWAAAAGVDVAGLSRWLLPLVPVRMPHRFATTSASSEPNARRTTNAPRALRSGAVTMQ